MNMISSFAYQSRRRTRKHPAGYSLLAAPLVYVGTFSMFGGIQYLPSAVAGPAAIAIEFMSIAVIFSVAVFLQTWWWPLISSLPSMFFIVSGVLLGAAIRGSDDTDMGFLLVIGALFLGVIGLIPFGIVGSLGVIVGKRLTKSADRCHGQTQPMRAGGICPQCTSVIPAGATKCPTCQHTIPREASRCDNPTPVETSTTL